MTTLAGLAGSGGSADGTGSAARFYRPLRRGGGQRGQRLCGGHIQPHDPESHASGRVTTLAGAGQCGSADGTGSAARFTPRRGGGQRGQRLCGGHGNKRSAKSRPREVTTLAGSGELGSDRNRQRRALSLPRWVWRWTSWQRLWRSAAQQHDSEGHTGRRGDDACRTAKRAVPMASAVRRASTPLAVQRSTAPATSMSVTRTTTDPQDRPRPINETTDDSQHGMTTHRKRWRRGTGCHWPDASGLRTCAVSWHLRDLVSDVRLPLSAASGLQFGKAKSALGGMSPI